MQTVIQTCLVVSECSHSVVVASLCMCLYCTVHAVRRRWTYTASSVLRLTTSCSHIGLVTHVTLLLVCVCWFYIYINIILCTVYLWFKTFVFIHYRNILNCTKWGVGYVGTNQTFGLPTYNLKFCKLLYFPLSCT